MPSKEYCVTIVVAAIVLAVAMPASAQAPSPALAGTIRDTSGAVMQAVPVRVFAEDGEQPVAEAVTDAQGHFQVPLPRGTYRVEVAAAAFKPLERTVTVGPGSKPLDLVLEIDVIGLEVEVNPGDELFADTTMSLTSTTMSGDELLNLPRNEEDLARYLLTLAGADSTGDLESDVLANFVIDGFEDGRLPSPDQIAQIVIDPDSLRAGSDGPRIEIITRPGTGDWRWSVDAGFADESLNARTPGETRKEPRQTRDVQFEVRGPLIPNKLEANFELSTRTDERAGNSLRAITPSGNLFTGVVQPQRGQQFEAGARLQLNSSHRVDINVSGQTERSENRGVGGFTLPERASERRGDQWSFRVSERMLSSNFTNNARFQVSSNTRRDVPLRDGFAIDVADAFSGGGGTTRGSEDTLAFRLDDNMRWARGSWNFEWQANLQYRSRQTIEQDNYNGTFEFSSLHDYCRATGFSGVNCAETERLVAEALAAGVVPTYFDARGRELPITGVPVTFTQAFGNSELELNELSLDTHIQIDRRFGRRASLGFGVQYGATNYSLDFMRLNPTVNMQYRLSDATLLSAGARMSFADFGDYERLRRNDGSTHQTELSISSPSFPDPFQGGTVEIGEDTASLWVLDPDYESPFTVAPQFSVTQQLPGGVRVTATYSLNYGRRQRRTRNINAPFPGTPLPEEILELPREERQEAIDRMRPLYPIVGNITQIESTGRSSGRTLQLRLQPRRQLELYGIEVSGNVNYTYRSAYDDNDFNNPYVPEWGPSRRDHQVQSRFRIGLPDDPAFGNPFWNALARATYAGTNFNFNLRANSGRLYSIQTGRDLNGDQSTRDRPIGVPRNSEVGPANWNLDLTLTKDFTLMGGGVEGGGGGGPNASQRQGGGGGGGGPRGGRGGGGGGFGRSDGPRLRFQARINNVLNRSQPRAYGSVLTSPLFGLPSGYTSGRTVALSMRIDF